MAEAIAPERFRSVRLGQGLEIAETRFFAHRFSPHRHDSYAIGTTATGVQDFRYPGVLRRARVGDVFILHPDEVHDGGPGPAYRFGYRIAYVLPELIAGRARPGRLCRQFRGAWWWVRGLAAPGSRFSR